MAKQLLRLPAVCERVGFKRSQIYALIKQKRFPEAVRLSQKTVAWDADLIDAWILARIEDSRRAA